MGSAACTIVEQKGRDNAYTTTGGFYCGVITTSSTKYYNYCLKFKTPTFSGTSSSVKFTISAMDNQPENSTVVLRYALCSSDANFSKYQTSGTPSDSYQIKTGTASFAVSSSYKNCSFTVSTTALKSNTTYYLIIYSRAGYTSQNSIHIRASTYHSATLNYSLPTYTLTLKKGTGIDSFTGAGTYEEGTKATTVATASSGYHITGYTGHTSTGETGGSWPLTGITTKTHTDNWTMNANRTITVTAAKDPVAHIDNGSSFDAYEIYIDNGSSWDRYIAYIDNGSSWDECN